jgi:hypothetical protein
MAGGVPTRELQVALAAEADDAEMRRLMRETAMAGSISVAFAREPCFAHASGVEGDSQTVVAREPSGRVVALFSRSTRPSWVGGEPRALSYLSALRIAPEYRNRPGLLRLGFRWVRELHEAEPGALPYALTTIVSDNAPARRLLERGLPGLPRYVPREELVTLAAPVSRRGLGRRRARPEPGLTVRGASQGDLPEIVAALARWGRRHPFSPVWDEPTLLDPVRSRDLRVTDFLVALRGPQMVGCAALWDQGRYKQSVVAGYSGPLRWLRRPLNLVAPALGMPVLPPAGTALRQVYLSHLAVDDDTPEVARALVGSARDRAREAGYDYLITTLAVRHPLQPVLRRLLRPFQYRSELYLVAWGELDGAPPGIPHLEVAVL